MKVSKNFRLAIRMDVARIELNQAMDRLNKLTEKLKSKTYEKAVRSN